MKHFAWILSIILLWIFLQTSNVWAGQKENDFVEAAMKGDLARLKIFLKKEKMDPNTKDDQNRIALTSALRQNQNETARLLIENGASVDVMINLVTPLIVTSWSGNVAITKLLIEKGADVNKKNDLGLSPLLAASGKGHFEIVKLLLDHGAEVNVKNSKGKTPLNAAREIYHVPIYKLLLEKGAKE
ncbi:MAG: ankyrin repeat domain-containing protein [SAR324 cluster bacterium]|nr:ankyrin repeat domain-containing protein [SAR324 cluster bacterium]